MSAPPKVFISATSGDLRSIRQIVKDALLTIDCHPVEQTNFEPDARTVENMLRAKIEGCSALIHIAGLRYGAEPDPATLQPGTPRRSYTQMEHHIGRQLQHQRGDARFRVYTFICPEDFPFDPEPDVESDELRALQREHRQLLLDDPHLRENPRGKAELQARILALQEQVLAIRQQQEEVRAEVARTRRFGIKAFAVIVLLLALLGAGIWQIMQGQKPNPESIRAAYREASERKLAEDNAASEKATTSAERQRLHAAAADAHAGRLARIDYHVADFIRLADDPATTFVLREMIRILSDPREKDRVETALAYADRQKAGVLERIRSRNAAIHAAKHEQNRTELQPLLKAADLQATSGQRDKARASYTQLLELESAWPEALTEFAWFLRDQSKRAQSYGTLSTALADAQQCHATARQILSLTPGKPDSVRLQCAALNQLGGLAVAQGDLAGALRYFTEAKTIAERLAASDDTNALWQRDLSVSLGKLGDIAIAQGDVTTALRYFKQELAIAERLAASDPANTQWQRDLSVSLVGLGDLAVTQGDLAEAMRYLSQAKAIAERIAASAPANAELQREHSVALNKLGELAVAQGDLAGALRCFTESKAIFERLAAADPANAEWQHDLSISLEKLGDLNVARGDLAGAMRCFSDAKVIAERLAAKDHTNAERQGGLAFALIKLGDLAKAKGDLPAASGYCNKANEIFERLAASDPGNAERQRDLSASLIRLGDLAVTRGDPPIALRYFSEARSIRERLATSAPANTAWQRDLSISLEKLGELAIAQGDLAGALRCFSESQAIRERLAASAPTNAAWQRDLWVAYGKLADHSEKSNQPAEAMIWWKKAHDTLAAMKQRGLQLSPEDEGFLERLRKTIGN